MNRLALFGVLLFAAGVLAGCGDAPSGASAAAPPAVTVARPLQKKITEWDEYTGRFTAVETVEVRARVSGFIDSIHFKDGQLVKQGDLLFVIDPRPYRFAVEQAKADTERAAAKLELARLDVQRATPLVQNQTLTGREFDTRKSTERDAAGQLASAEATVKQAELNLEWTQVRAPIAGRVSDRRVDMGNLITGGQTGATVLTVIVSQNPIHFLFDGSEADFIHYLRLAAADSAIASDQSRKIVFVVAEDGTVGVKLVELGPLVDGLRVIRSGLGPTDRLVIEGLPRARPGQRVKAEDGVVEPPARPAPASAP